MTVAPRAFRKASAGSTKADVRPSRAISGRHAWPPTASVSRKHRRRQPGGRFARLGIEGGQQQRPHQPVVQHAAAIDDLADRLAGGRPQQPRQRQVVAQPRSRHAPLADRTPTSGMRPSLISIVQRSLVARSTNGKVAVGGPTSASAAPIACRKARAPRDCPTAADDCRCRSSCPRPDRDRTGSVRPPAPPPRARRRVRPVCTSLTAAARPASPAPMTWTVRAIRRSRNAG